MARPVILFQLYIFHSHNMVIPIRVHIIKRPGAAMQVNRRIIHQIPTQTTDAKIRKAVWLVFV
jgi:hypothetical protein